MVRQEQALGVLVWGTHAPDGLSALDCDGLTAWPGMELTFAKGNRAGS
jgi:hypothetical protein